MKSKIVMLALSLLLILGVALIGCAKPAPAPTPAPAPAPTPAPTEKVIEISFGGKEPGEIPLRYEQMFTDLVNERGKGKVKMTYYPRAQLGSAPEQIDKVSAGALDMVERSTAALVKYVPWETIQDLPFAGFSSVFTYKLFWDKIMGPEENKDLAKFNMMNLSHVGMMGGSHVYSAAGPIQSLADFKGKLFRAKSPGIEVKWMQLLGAKATVMPFAELYGALEQNVVDLMHNPARDAIGDNFYEVCPDMTVANIKFFGYLIIVNTDFWNSLPVDIQEMIDSSWEEAAYAWTAEARELEINIYEMLQQPPYNMNIYFPTDEQMAEIREAVMPVYEFAKEELPADKIDLLLNNVK